jgi:aryl-alcohol dehydrogenase-like predicted oxidoreductase
LALSLRRKRAFSSPLSSSLIEVGLQNPSAPPSHKPSRMEKDHGRTNSNRRIGEEYIGVPGASLDASRIALGTWAMGGWMWGGTDEAEAIRTIHAAIDRGVTLIDTAPVYGFGCAEEIVGKALAEGGRRDRQAPRFGQYLRAVEKLDRFAQAKYGRRVIHLALRWILDRQDLTIALWGARRPDQLDPIAGLSGWRIDAPAMAEIDRILSETIIDPVGPEFMAPPDQRAA